MNDFPLLKCLVCGSAPFTDESHQPIIFDKLIDTNVYICSRKCFLFYCSISKEVHKNPSRKTFSCFINELKKKHAASLEKMEATQKAVLASQAKSSNAASVNHLRKITKAPSKTVSTKH